MPTHPVLRGFSETPRSNTWLGIRHKQKLRLLEGRLYTLRGTQGRCACMGPPRRPRGVSSAALYLLRMRVGILLRRGLGSP